MFQFSSSFVLFYLCSFSSQVYYNHLVFNKHFPHELLFYFSLQFFTFTVFAFDFSILTLTLCLLPPNFLGQSFISTSYFLLTKSLFAFTQLFFNSIFISKCFFLLVSLHVSSQQFSSICFILFFRLLSSQLLPHFIIRMECSKRQLSVDPWQSH